VVGIGPNRSEYQPSLAEAIVYLDHQPGFQMSQPVSLRHNGDAGTVTMQSVRFDLAHMLEPHHFILNAALFNSLFYADRRCAGTDSAFVINGCFRSINRMGIR
jgi:hypothetical protein